MTFGDLVLSVVYTILNPLVAVMFAAALLLFFWGLVKYIQSEAGSGKGEGKTLMIWGVVALFVMVSVWGLVNLIRDSIPGLTENNLHAIPLRR